LVVFGLKKLPSTTDSKSNHKSGREVGKALYSVQLTCLRVVFFILNIYHIFTVQYPFTLFMTDWKTTIVLFLEKKY